MIGNTCRKILGLGMLVLALGVSAPAWAQTPTNEQGAAGIEGSNTAAPAAAISSTEERFKLYQEKNPGLNRLDQAVGFSLEEKIIEGSAAKGFLGIPGAPEVNIIAAFIWAIWVGWIFSTVGAFGGVMASVGHISVFGLGKYAGDFGKGHPLNKVVTDSIRVSNQWLVGCSSLISSLKYGSMGRIVLPLGIALGIGSVAGAILVPWLTAGKVDFKAYVGYFGIFVLFLGLFLFYETLPHVRAKKKTAAAAAKAFEEAAKSHTADTKETKVKVVSISVSRVVFTFCGVEFSFNTFLPVIGGFLISAVAAFLGVGGGFLIVPFLTSISQLPMYLAAGTSAFVVLIGMITSITTFMSGGTPVYWPLIGVELGGIVIGSLVGPMTAKYIPDIWLKRLFIVIALVVGTNYVLRGFTTMRLW